MFISHEIILSYYLLMLFYKVLNFLQIEILYLKIFGYGFVIFCLRDCLIQKLYVGFMLIILVLGIKYKILSIFDVAVIITK